MGEEPFNWTDSDKELQAVEDYRDFRNMVGQLPPIKPKEPKTGHWFAWKPEDDVWRTTCSECGEETRTLWNYCPNCGVKMKSEVNNGQTNK
jgi:hypothetical protein